MIYCSQCGSLTDGGFCWSCNPLSPFAQVGRNAKRQDPNADSGLGPKDEHAVGEADAPNLSIDPPETDSAE